MSWLRALANRVAAVFRKSDLDEDFSSELAAHLEFLTEENIKLGMTPEEARRVANIRLGGVEATKELHRDTRGLPFFETLKQDLKYTFRTLRRDAGFTTFAILIVGLGIAACCTIFSVVNTLLVRPLPFRDPAHLMWMANEADNEGNDLSGRTVQVGHLLDYRERNRSFEDIAGFMAFYGTGDAKLTGSGEPERLTNVPVSQNFFPLLGVEPERGRNFTADEAKFNGPNVVLITHGLWKRRFGLDPNILSKPLTINEQATSVIGILPESFDFGTVFAPGTHVDTFSVFPLTEETNRWGNTMALVSRLKAGTSLASAQAEGDVISQQIVKDHPDRNTFGPKITPLATYVSSRIRTALIVLACAVGVVMLIVCANLSNLLLARGAARQKEIAIRAALGASKLRLMRQTLTESLFLSFCGGLLGLLLAFAGTRALAHMTGVSIPLLDTVHLDGSAVLFALLVTVVTGIVFGLVPALQIPGVALHDSLKDANRGSSVGRGHRWIRNGLVVSEIALACVLLVGAGLLIHSFIRVLDVNLGFHPERAATLRIDPGAQYTTQDMRNEYFTEALRRVKEVPGVEAAGISDALPLGHNRTWGVAAQGVTYKPGEYPSAFVRIISDGYFQAMGIPLIAGRDFTARDLPKSEQEIIVNQTLAARLWPGQDPIGKTVTQDSGRHVVGVVGDVRHLALEVAGGAEMYLPMRQTGDYGSVDLVVRSSMATAELSGRLREALRPIAPDLPAAQIRTIQSLVDKSVSPRRFVVILLGGFAVFALILSSLGIYAVISYNVSQQTQEIGIRMALGASAEVVRKSILAHTLRLTMLGMLIGLVVSAAMVRALSTMLFGVTATDPFTFAAMVVVLTGVAALAGYLPARRASQIDPMEALRVS